MLLNSNNRQMEVVQPIAAKTLAFPVSLVQDMHYFACTMLNHHMHRTDGKRLGFQFGIFATQDMYDIEYMNKEIDAGNIYISKATNEQISIYRMKVDPKAMLTEQLSPQIEAELRDTLNAELRDKMQARLTSIGMVLSEEQLNSLWDTTPTAGKEESTVMNSDAPDSRAELISKLQAGSATITLGGIVGTDKLPQAAPSTQN